jgi:hypothetical protein
VDQGRSSSQEFEVSMSTFRVIPKLSKQKSSVKRYWSGLEDVCTKAYIPPSLGRGEVSKVINADVI